MGDNIGRRPTKAEAQLGAFGQLMRNGLRESLCLKELNGLWEGVGR